MSDLPTITIELDHGYTDDEGVKHKRAILRVPLIEDEIKRDMEITKLRLSQSENDRLLAESESFNYLALIAQCTVSLGTCPVVTIPMLRSMRRTDTLKLIQAMNKLEEVDEEDQAKN